MSVRVGNDIIAGSTSDQLISTAIETHNRDVNAHADIRAGISAATPVVDLGQVTSASFEVNKNYAASVSGTAAFTLPTPTGTTIANKITVNLTVLSASNIDWGANANAALAEFAPGKYQIRLLWNNNSSAWTAEALKETKVESNVKTFISFNGNYSDECGTVSLTLNNSPSYSQGPFENYQSLGVSRNHSPLTMSGDLTKWNFGLNPFKITCWVLNSNNAYFDIFSSSDARTRVNTMGQCTANGVNLNPTTTSFSIAAWTFLEFGRGSDGIFRFFVNGVQKMQKDASTIEADFSNAGRMFSNYGSGSTAYMSDFVISAESVSQADYTRPTMPFVLSDNGVSDLHDDTLATKTELAGYLPLSGGILTGALTLASFISFTADRSGKSQIILPGSGEISGFDTGNIFIHNANNGLIFRKSDNQLVRRRDSVDSILLTEAEKAVANGVASLDANGKVPLSQLPDNIGGGGAAAPTLKWYKNNTGSSITIDDTSSSSRVKVYKNGVLLEPEEDYSISGTTLVLITNLTINDKITTEVF